MWHDAILMSLLLVAALAWFFRTMRVKVGVLLRLRPDRRWDHVGQRLINTVTVALAQAKMFKDPWPGLMHAFIFWGFLVLLVRSISLVGMAYTTDFEWSLLSFWPALDAVYTWLKDWTELVVLAMVLVAFFRRLVVRPERLTMSSSAYIILGLIGVLMVTDFLFDGSRFALGFAKAEQAHAPIGSLVAGWMEGTSPALLRVIRTASYWVHIVTLLYFLNFLPLSKHFHVITSIPNVFFSRLGSPGALSPILDIENQERFGVSQARDLTWKQALDGYSCTECGRCSVNCPAHQSGKPLNPKLVIDEMRDFVKAREGALLGGTEGDEGPTLASAVGEEAIWSCTTCRSCEENCPVTITHVDKIVDLRRNLVLVEGRYNPEVGTALKNLENRSNPWGLPRNDRGMWAVEAGVPLLSEHPDAEVLFFMGCFAAYDDRNRRVAAAVIRLMQRAGVDFAVLGGKEGCCGDPARRLGNEYLFQMQATENIETFKAHQVKRIVTACPHCMNTLKNEYPQWGGVFEVEHHTVMLARLLAEGRLPRPRQEDRHPVVFHDSCYLGRYNGIYEAPRAILRALATEVPEAEASQKGGLCCGAGGGLMFREEKTGERMNHRRLAQLQVKAPLIASACPYCLVMLRDGINERELQEQVRAMDVAEMLDQNLQA